MGTCPKDGLTGLLLITIVIGSNPAPRKSAPHRLTISHNPLFLLGLFVSAQLLRLAHCSRRVLLLPGRPFHLEPAFLDVCVWTVHAPTTSTVSGPQSRPERDRASTSRPRRVQRRQERRSPSTRRERGHRRRLRGDIDPAWQRWPRLHRAACAARVLSRTGPYPRNRAALSA